MSTAPDPESADLTHATTPGRDSSAVLVAPGAGRVVTVTGEDRLTFLDDVLSQQVRSLAAGAARGALWLDVHGAPLAMLTVVALEDEVVLLLPDAEMAEVMVDTLGRRTFLAQARFAHDERTVVAVRGGGLGAVTASAGLAFAPGTEAAVSDLGGVDVLAVRAPGRPADSLDLVVAPEHVDEVVAALAAAGAAPGGADDLEAWRVANGVPGWGSEVTAPHLPEEAGVLATHVHLAKGCYPGQEAVARMWMLGRPRRRLAAVTVDSGVTPGWEVGASRRRVTVTSVAGGVGRGLAYVPADAAVGDRFADDDDRGVEVVTLVNDELTVPGHDPAMTRRRDRRAAS